MSSTRILYDLKPYLAQNAVFFQELQSASQTGQLSIAKLFSILPLNVLRPFNGRALLEQRGSFNRTGSEFVNAASQAIKVTFLDDQLDEIAATFPRYIALRIDGTDRISVTSVGETIRVEFKILPADFPVVQPIRFDSFSITPATMITQFVDSAGNTIILDGSDNNNLRADAVSLQAILKALDSGADSPCPNPTEPPPQQDWKYAIQRDGNSGYCRVITPGVNWGNRTLGTYDTQADAEAAMQQFLNDGEPPNNTNPTCEGRG